jgi:GcrA cell cycle regulator
MEWTRAQIDELTRLWGEGLTGSQIGQRMGITKCAVLGKVHRLGLPVRGSPINSPRLTPEQIAHRQKLGLLIFHHKRAGVKLPKLPKIKTVPVRRMIREMPDKVELHPTRTCQHIPEDPKVNPAMCGKRALLNSPWCPECYVRLTMPVKAREAA